MVITGERAFSVPEHSFSVSPSAEGYTLNYGNNGANWTAYDKATPANEVLFVYGVPKFSYFKLVGNNSQVEIKW